MLLLPHESLSKPQIALAGLSLALAMPAAPPCHPQTATKTAMDLVERPRKPRPSLQERDHLLKSRKPLLKRSTSKTRRTRSFSTYDPPKRDALEELSRATGSAPDPSEAVKASDDSVVRRLPSPHDNVTLRHVRRRDVPRVQALLSQTILDHLGNEEYGKPGDFGSAVEYVEEFVDRDQSWISLDRPADGDDDNEDNEDEDEDSKRKAPRVLAVALDDELIGLVEAWLDVRDSACTAELVYWLGEPYWGRGIMSRVVSAYVEYLWATFPWITRLDAGVYATWNPHSRRILEKLGFSYEGSMRSAVWRAGKGGYSDIEMWGMLRQDWEAGRPTAES